MDFWDPESVFLRYEYIFRKFRQFPSPYNKFFQNWLKKCRGPRPGPFWKKFCIYFFQKSYFCTYSIQTNLLGWTEGLEFIKLVEIHTCKFPKFRKTWMNTKTGIYEIGGTSRYGYNPRVVTRRSLLVEFVSQKKK